MTDKKRVKFIDMVKGLTMLCIALFHIIAPGTVRTVIAGMCAVLFFSFFFYSGYLYTPGKNSIKRSIVNRCKGLLKPFLLYSVSFWAVGSIILIAKGMETVTDALCCLRNFFGGSIWNRTIQDWFAWDYHHLGSSYPFLASFWFLPAMFLSSVLFIALREKICKSVKPILLMTAVMLVVTGVLRSFGISLIYNIQLIPFWTAIMLAGSAARETNLFGKLEGSKAGVYGAILSVVGIGSSVYFGWGTNLFRGEFDKPEAVTMLVLFCLGIINVLGLSLLFRQTEDSFPLAGAIAYLGSHSIFIYMYHYFVAWIICMFTGFSMRYDADNVTGEVLAKSFILAVVSITVSILISICSDKIKSKQDN